MREGWIEADGLWKKFGRGRQHDSLRDFIPALLRGLRGRGADDGVRNDREFWAVQNVSFQVRPGESLGLLGHNGAGKSTILKLLTRILRPTRGRCVTRGRIGALVEVAGGFHPDLTGRENVYLQGSIMGMSRSEVAAKYDAIVDFSGISKFIDTPVKRYSTGMLARLGFSVAAHIDPDILIIDEVLAVGDLTFQKQAYQRIRELATSGRPVVVVSHQLSVIEELCQRAILLEQGQVRFDGPTRECIARYVGSDTAAARTLTEDAPVALERATLRSGTDVESGGRVELEVSGRLMRAVPEPHVEPLAIIVKSLEHGNVSLIGSRECGVRLLHAGEFEVRVSLQMNVPAGLYELQTIGWDKQHESAFCIGPTVALRVLEGPPFRGIIQLNAHMRCSGAESGLPGHTPASAARLETLES